AGAVRTPDESLAAAASAGTGDVSLYQQHDFAQRQAAFVPGHVRWHRARARAARHRPDRDPARRSDIGVFRGGTGWHAADTFVLHGVRLARGIQLSGGASRQLDLSDVRERGPCPAYWRGAEMDYGDGHRSAVCAAGAGGVFLSRLAPRAGASEFRPAALAGAVEPAAGVVPQDPIHLLLLSRQDQHGGDVP